MNKTIPIHPSDLRGLSRLTIAAITGMTETVELMHHNIARFPFIFGRPTKKRMGGIPGLAYGSVRGITRVVGTVIDMATVPLVALTRKKDVSFPEREAFLAALNGVLGDYMKQSVNPLTISMQLRLKGRPLDIKRQALSEAFTTPKKKLLIMVHGLCRNDLQWMRKGHDHGTAIGKELGYSVVYLHYNTGLHISENGKSFADVIDKLVREWPVPVEELSIIGHSMGGLLARSACHYGNLSGHTWLDKLKKIIFLGTPHQGATAERVGNMFDFILELSPYSAALARVGKIRSAGVTDMRYGSVTCRDQDDIDRFALSGDCRLPTPLPKNAACFAIGVSIRKEEGKHGNCFHYDGLVPLNSALGRHKDPAMALDFSSAHQWVKYGINHFDMLSDPDVYEKIQEFFSI